MAARLLKTATLSTLLLAPFSVGAMAQNAGSPPPPVPAPTSVRGWITGHPLTDFFVVLAIVVVLAGTYLMRLRSHA
jgi:hypothetical protein